MPVRRYPHGAIAYSAASRGDDKLHIPDVTSPDAPARQVEPALFLEARLVSQAARPSGQDEERIVSTVHDRISLRDHNGLRTLEAVEPLQPKLLGSLRGDELHRR
jgi:hypothetical protein